MKFAAIADVHGNCVALEAVLSDIAALGITDVVDLAAIMQRFDGYAAHASAHA